MKPVQCPRVLPKQLVFFVRVRSVVRSVNVISFVYDLSISDGGPIGLLFTFLNSSAKDR